MFRTQCEFSINIEVSSSSESNSNEAVIETFCSTRPWADYTYRDVKRATSPGRKCLAVVIMDIEDHNEFAAKCNMLFNNLGLLVGVTNVNIKYDQEGIPYE